jgi:hypothetical protein
LLPCCRCRKKQDSRIDAALTREHLLGSYNRESVYARPIESGLSVQAVEQGSSEASLMKKSRVSAEEAKLASREYMRTYMRHYRSNGRRRCSECGALLKEKKDEGGKEG